MLLKFGLPLVAAFGLAFAIYTVVLARQPAPPSQPLTSPPTQPEFRSIAGAGLIEAKRENIPIGSPAAGVVTQVMVQAYQPTEADPRPNIVKKGDPLFTLDDRMARAEIRVSEAAVKAAEAELYKLNSAPRPEDLPPARAALSQTQATLRDAEAEYTRSVSLRQRNAITDSEFDRARYAYEAAKASNDKTRADLEKLESGTWRLEIAQAEARLAEAQARLEADRTSLELLTVRALEDGEVLQVNVRPGQFAALAWKEPLIVLGDLSKLHVRVDIDEQDVPYFRRGTRAIATLKGRPQVRFPLEFVRVEPYVIPKRSLTGDNSERVDTRVLQVIYSLPDDRPMPLYVGQQMDVFVEATPPPEGITLESSGNDFEPFSPEKATN